MWWLRSDFHDKMKWQDRVFVLSVKVTLILFIIIAIIPALICSLLIGIEWLLYKAGWLKERWLDDVLDPNHGVGDFEKGIRHPEHRIS